MCKRFGLTLTLGVLIALTGAVTAQANHTPFGAIQVKRGDALVAQYTNFGSVCDFALSACDATVTTNTRDYGRFVRWCGSDTVTLVIAGGSFSQATSCLGGGSWYIGINTYYALTAAPTGGTQVDLQVLKG